MPLALSLPLCMWQVRYEGANGAGPCDVALLGDGAPKVGVIESLGGGTTLSPMMTLCVDWSDGIRQLVHARYPAPTPPHPW